MITTMQSQALKNQILKDKLVFKEFVRTIHKFEVSSNKLTK